MAMLSTSDCRDNAEAVHKINDSRHGVVKGTCAGGAGMGAATSGKGLEVLCANVKRIRDRVSSY
jgi:hypothetical protein